MKGTSAILLCVAIGVACGVSLPATIRPCLTLSVVHCLVDPCSVSSCPQHPDAVCVSNYCGGCHHEYFDDQGHRLADCSSPLLLS